jgi:hypothetical protein
MAKAPGSIGAVAMPKMAGRVIPRKGPGSLARKDDWTAKTCWS